MQLLMLFHFPLPRCHVLSLTEKGETSLYWVLYRRSQQQLWVLLKYP